MNLFGLCTYRMMAKRLLGEEEEIRTADEERFVNECHVHCCLHDSG
jgi:hypothetical protein